MWAKQTISLLFISMENGNKVRRIYNIGLKVTEFQGQTNRASERLPFSFQQALLLAAQVLEMLTLLQLGDCLQSA